MTKKTFSLLVLSLSASLFVYSFFFRMSTEGIPTTNIEALSDTEGNRVVCRCNYGWWTNDKCKASNDDDICAMGAEYGNINCGNYNGNC